MLTKRVLMYSFVLVIVQPSLVFYKTQDQNSKSFTIIACSQQGLDLNSPTSHVKTLV